MTSSIIAVFAAAAQRDYFAKLVMITLSFYSLLHVALDFAPWKIIDLIRQILL